MYDANKTSGHNVVGNMSHFNYIGNEFTYKGTLEIK